MRLLISDIPDDADFGYIIECIHRVTSADIKIQQLIEVVNETNDGLIDAVLTWWEQHEYDVVVVGDDEDNMYDSEPQFVEIAKQLRDTRRS
jgi:hypothetical protein